MKLFAVTWKSGKARIGIVGIYASEKKAREIHSVLVEHGDMDKVFEVHPIDAEDEVNFDLPRLEVEAAGIRFPSL